MMECILYNIDGVPVQWFQGFDSWRIRYNIIGERLLEMFFGDESNCVGIILTYENGYDYLLLYEGTKIVFRHDFL